jgi:hypothetical protein
MTRRSFIAIGLAFLTLTPAAAEDPRYFCWHSGAVTGGGAIHNTPAGTQVSTLDPDLTYDMYESEWQGGEEWVGIHKENIFIGWVTRKSVNLVHPPRVIKYPWTR